MNTPHLSTGWPRFTCEVSFHQMETELFFCSSFFGSRSKCFAWRTDFSFRDCLFRTNLRSLTDIYKQCFKLSKLDRNSDIYKRCFKLFEGVRQEFLILYIYVNIGLIFLTYFKVLLPSSALYATLASSL